MMISLSIIIILAVLLAIALAAPLFSPFFRRVEEEDVPSDDADGVLPPVSIVIVEHDSANDLERVLPMYLGQEYKADYQVVVVIDQSDVKSEEILKLQAEHHSNLYYTLLPDSSRYVSRKKLGMTLGIRAAKYEWLLFADVNCAPTSQNWLANVARHCGDDKNLVLGTTQYEDFAPSYYRFEQLRTMLYYFRQAQTGIPFSTNQSIVMMRRSEFFEEKGFYGNLEYARAEYEFIVNKFGRENACAIAMEPEARMVQTEPAPVQWSMKQLFAIDALNGLERAGKFRMMYRLDLAVMHLVNVLSFIAVACGALLASMQIGNAVVPSLSTMVEGMAQYDGIALSGGALLIWIISIVERMTIYSKQLEYFDCCGAFSAVVMEWGMSLRNVILRIKYHFADKNDFITHKL